MEDVLHLSFDLGGFCLYLFAFKSELINFFDFGREISFGDVFSFKAAFELVFRLLKMLSLLLTDILKLFKFFEKLLDSLLILCMLARQKSVFRFQLFDFLFGTIADSLKFLDWQLAAHAN